MRKFFASLVFVATMIELTMGQTLTASTKIIDNKINIEIQLKNETKNELLLVSPNFGSSSPASYVFEVAKDSRTLQIRRQFFEYPHASISDLDEPCMILKRLKPGSSYNETVSLGYPIAVDNYILPRKLDIREYSSIQMFMGVMPFDEGIYEIHDWRPFGHCVMYLDVVSNGPYKGKELIDIQKIVASEATQVMPQ